MKHLLAETRCVSTRFSARSAHCGRQRGHPGADSGCQKILTRLQMLDPELRVFNLADRVNFRRPDDFRPVGGRTAQGSECRVETGSLEELMPSLSL
jgi:hypothetical protein